MASPLATVLASAYAPPGEYRPGTVAPTNVADITANSTDAAYKNYAAQLQKQNAMFGGLAGLGSAGILGFGPKLSGKLFGSGTGVSSGGGLFSGLFGSGAVDAAAGGAADAAASGAADAGLTGLAGIGSDVAAASLLPAAADTAIAAAPEAVGGLSWLADALPFLFAV